MVVKVVTWTLFIYFAYCGVLFLVQRQMLFPRYLVETPSQDEDIPFVEKIWIVTFNTQYTMILKTMPKLTPQNVPKTVPIVPTFS